MNVPRPEAARLLPDSVLDEHERELAGRIPAEQRYLAAIRRERRRRERVQRHRIEAALRTVIRGVADGVPG